MVKIAIHLSILAMILTGCNLPLRVALPTRPTATQPVEATARPTVTNAPESTTEPGTTTAVAPQILGQEAIEILEPGPASRVLSPLRLAGVADPTHEQTLVVRGLRLDGSELIAPQPITIMAPLGERGPYEIEIPFSVSQDEQVFIQIYDLSARDGGIRHLASVGVILSVSGPESITPWSSYPEQIVITTPENGVLIAGGVAHIEGVGVASFEGTFVLEIMDADGAVVGSQAVIASAPDLGLPGAFSADVSYSVAGSGPGRVVVRDPSPAFGDAVHLASVEVQLAP